MLRSIVLAAGICGFIAVVIGAHAAHGLESSLADKGVGELDIPKRVDQCEVAVRYQMSHALGLLFLSVVGKQAKRRAYFAATFFLLGILLFSGGLYVLVYAGPDGPGPLGYWAIVPSGGLCFLLGWLGITSLAFTRSEPAH